MLQRVLRPVVKYTIDNQPMRDTYPFSVVGLRQANLDHKARSGSTVVMGLYLMNEAGDLVDHLCDFGHADGVELPS